MGFKTILYNIPHAIKATHFLLQCGYSKQATQKLLDKSRVRQNNAIVKKSDMLSQGVVEILSFIPDNMGIMPFFACLPPTHAMARQTDSVMKIAISDNLPYFCVFNKPAKFLTHPKNLADSKSMLDALRYHFGKNCNPCHRLDYETSGLLLCAIDKKSEVMLKNLFLERNVNKTYLAIVRGAVTQSMQIESDITFAKDFGNLCIQGAASNLKTTIIKRAQIDEMVSNFAQKDMNNKAVSIMQPLQIFKDLNALFDYLSNNIHFLPLQYHNHIQNNIKMKNMDSILCNINFFDMHKKAQQYELWLSSLKENYHLDSIYKNNKGIKHEKCNDMKHSGQFSLVRLMPLSGKTHQLRIHTASIHHAILGDTLYGLHSVFASFFLDIQSKKVKHNLNSYLHNTISSLNLNNIKQNHIIYFYKRDKNVVQKMLYITHKKHFLQKDSINDNSLNRGYIFIPSFSLSKILISCFFSQNPLETKEEDVFFKFLLFYYGLPSKQEQILQDMRFYYCNSERLLLHAFKLQFLNQSFTCP